MLTPDDRVVVYMRPGCHVCARVKNFLTEHGVPYDARDVDGDPLTPRELWELFNRKANRLRVPFTALNDGEDVVLGFDPQRLEGVFVHGELGGVQVASQVSDPVIYDDFRSGELDRARWVPIAAAQTSGSAAEDGCCVDTGDGQLRLCAAAGAGGYVSTQRFGLPPGSLVSFDVDVAFEVPGRFQQPTVGQPMAELSLRDLPSGMLLGFEVTNEAILAVHRRGGVEGVAAEAEHFSHRVITELDTLPGQSHRYRLSYQHDTSEARWYVDERCVYVAISPLQIEGVSPSMGVLGGGNPAGTVAAPASATFGPWRVTPT